MNRGSEIVRILTLLSLCALLLCSGCSWFLIGGAGVLVMTLTGQDDNSEVIIPNNPPSVTVTEPTLNQLVADRVLVKYTLTDAEAEDCAVTVEYTTDGGALWQPATALNNILNDGIASLEASAAGTKHTFVWNSFHDLGNQNFPDGLGNGYVRLRITPTDAAGDAGMPVPSDDFRLYNGYLSTYLGGELSELDLAFPGQLRFLSGGGTGTDKLYFTDEFASTAHVIDLDSGQVTVVAGTGDPGYTGDNVPADQAGLTMPSEIAIDGEGNLFIADNYAHRVRRVDADSGFITTAAGTGERGDEGDGGSPTLTELAHPQGVAYDQNKELLYIADTENDRICVTNLGGQPRQVSGVWVQPGAMVTLIGNPEADYSQDREGLAGPSGSAGEYVSLASDSTGKPHVAYHDAINGDLKYAQWDDTNKRWWIEVVDSEGWVGEYCSLALNASNLPRISYYDSDAGALKLAIRMPSGGWDIVVVDDRDDCGTHTSLALASATGYPCISYVAEDVDELRVATFNGFFWASEAVDWGDFSATDIAVDQSGYPHVIYHDAGGKDLYYRHYNGTDWNVGPTENPIATAGNVGSYCSLALDTTVSPAVPHVVYYDGDTAGGSVMYTKYDHGGTAWLAPVTADDGSPSDQGTWCDIALDTSQRPHVIWHEEDYNNGSIWYAVDLNGDGDFDDPGERRDVDGMDESDDIGEFASLSVSGTNPRLCYVQWDDTNSSSAQARLRYAQWVGAPVSAWSRRQVDGGHTAVIGSPMDLELDPDGNLFISTSDRVLVLNNGLTELTLGNQITIPPFYVRVIAGLSKPRTRVALTGGTPTPHVIWDDPSNGLLKYAYHSGVTWPTSTVPDTSTEYGGTPDMVSDGSGNLHVSYWDAAANTLKYAMFDGSSWTFETPDPTTGRGQYSAIAVDPGSGGVAISYFDATNENLMFVSKTGPSWGTPVTVDTSGVGRFTDLAFDGNNNPAITYRDTTNRSLKYAYRSSGTWYPETADSDESCGLDTSLAFDASNQPHIAHRGDVRRVLKYATFGGAWSATGNTWGKQVVDGFGDVGVEPSIVVQGTTGDVFIAYEDASRNTLMLAKWNTMYWERQTLWDGGARPDLLSTAAGDMYCSFSLPWDAGKIRLLTIPFSGGGNAYTVYERQDQESFGGDGQIAIDAAFDELRGIGLARLGTYASNPPDYDALLLADSNNSRVRVINLSNTQSLTIANRTLLPGDIETILGDGDFAYDSTDEGQVVDNETEVVELAMPQDVAWDGDHGLFVSDGANLRIRFLNFGTTATTVCGVTVPAGAFSTLTGSANVSGLEENLFYPYGIAVDPVDGAVLLSDYGGAIFRVDPTTRLSTVIAGNGSFGFGGDGGPATDAEFWAPHQVAVDRRQNVYILDRGNQRVRVVNDAGDTDAICGVTVALGNIDTLLGTGVTTGSVDGPGGDASDDLGDGGACTSATVTDLGNIVIDTRATINGVSNPRGLMYVSDSYNRRVRAINLNPAGSGDITVAGVTISPGEIETVAGNGSALWQTDGPGGNPSDDLLSGASPTSVPISRPSALAIDSEGILLVFDRDPNILIGINTGTSAKDLAGMTIDAGKIELLAGRIYAERGYNGDGIPALDASFDEPEFIAVWREGYGTAGEIQEVLITDRRQQRIRLIDEFGFINTWAGTGAAGYNGEGVPPANALVNDPAGIAVYENGSNRYYFYTDSRNKRVRWMVK